MPSPSGPRSLVIRGFAIAAGIAWVTALFIVGFGGRQDDTPPTPSTVPDAVIEPIESYDSADLRRAADALEALESTRLTPDERDAVGMAADALGDLATGDATLAPVTTAPPATTTTTQPTTTTTTVPPSTTAPPTADDFADSIADQFGVELPDDGG